MYSNRKNAVAFIAGIFFLFLFAGFASAAADSRPQTFHLKNHVAPASAYSENYSTQPGTAVRAFGRSDISNIGLETYSTSNSSPFKLYKPGPDVAFYQLSVKSSLYLCAKKYSDSRNLRNTSCLAAGSTYFDEIILVDSDGGKYSITLQNYKDGDAADVYLNSEKTTKNMVGSFKLNDLENDVVTGCVTQNNKKVCIMLDGDEQKDMSIDIDYLWVTVKNNSAPVAPPAPLPPAPVPAPAKSSNCVSESVAKLDAKFASDIFGIAIKSSASSPTDPPCTVSTVSTQATTTKTSAQSGIPATSSVSVKLISVDEDKVSSVDYKPGEQGGLKNDFKFEMVLSLSKPKTIRNIAITEERFSAKPEIGAWSTFQEIFGGGWPIVVAGQSGSQLNTNSSGDLGIQVPAGTTKFYLYAQPIGPYVAPDGPMNYPGGGDFIRHIYRQFKFFKHSDSACGYVPEQIILHAEF